jgi:hypothetical protein
MWSSRRRVVVMSLIPVAVLGVTAALITAGHSDSGHDPDADRSVVHTSKHRAPAIPFTRTSGITEFAGLGSSESYAGTTYFWTPGEPTVAVGPSDILQTANQAAAVFNKSGTKMAEFDFGTFWPGGTANNPLQCTDPRALYLSTVNRFAISCSATSMRFAISQTADPTGGWYKYAAPNTSFLDQDKIEATSDKFIIAGNTSTNESIYVYNLADVVAGVSKPVKVHKTAAKSNVYQAAVQQTPTSAGYLVSSFPGNKLYLAQITGTPAANNVALTETTVSSTDFPAPAEPAVPGGHIGGGLLDGRVYDAVYEVESSDSKPVIQYSSARECGSRVCASSARIDLSGTKPVLSSDQLVGEPGVDDSYGAVGLDGAGDPFEVYTQTSATQTPSATVTGPGFVATLQAGGAGTTSCQSGATPPCDERWGDYFGTAIDPGDPTSVWVTATYQGLSGDYGYSTVIAKVSTSTLALPTVTADAASKISASGATLTGTVNPNGVATTYHVDYGLTSGYDTATTETSAGSGTSPVAVSAKLTGLQGNTTYHYRIVATTSAGQAVTADRTFKTSGPSITSVTFTGTPSAPTITITGKNLGSAPAGSPAGCGASGQNFGTALWFNEVTASWSAGTGGDCIGIVLGSYSSTTVSYQFGSFYDTNGLAPLTAGDQFQVTVLGKTFTGTVAFT